MYRITYSISKKQDKALVRRLHASGISDFFIETSGTATYLHIFSPTAEPPAVMEGFTGSVSEADESGWLHAWADSFTGHELTGDFYVAGEGREVTAGSYMYIIRIDPRDSFGDGHHPTTRLCAQLLQEHISGLENPGTIAMIDIGTGSGILAIEAYMLGVRDIDLFDIDVDAVNMAAKNLELNHVTGVVPLVGDIFNYDFTRRYDIITANLLTGLIEKNISSVKNALAINGVLIVSGISSKWTGLAKRIFKRNKLTVQCHKKLEGWNGFLLKANQNYLKKECK